MFLIRKPSVLFVFLEIRFMCVSHDRSEKMSTPRHVELVGSIHVHV